MRENTLHPQIQIEIRLKIRKHLLLKITRLASAITIQHNERKHMAPVRDTCILASNVSFCKKNIKHAILEKIHIQNTVLQIREESSDVRIFKDPADLLRVGKTLVRQNHGKLWRNRGKSERFLTASCTDKHSKQLLTTFPPQNTEGFKIQQFRYKIQKESIGWGFSPTLCFNALP